MTEEEFDAWRDLAQTPPTRPSSSETPDGQELLDMALAVE